MLTFAGSPAFATYDPNPPTWNPSGSYSLLFSYYFRGTSLNTSSVFNEGWVSGSGDTGPVNSAETAGYNSSLISLTGTGYLNMPIKYGQQVTTPDGTFPNTGTLLDTYGHFTFGPGSSVEARIYLPGNGSINNWPAFWADGEGLNWPADGEMDIMEGLGGQACYHFHSPAGGPGGCASGNYSGWHTFGADWETNSVTYYYDGKRVGQITSGITTSPMFLILDDTTSASSGTSDTMQVDWVKVWQN
jgi:beta-glucanase (GH16 family)